MSKPTMSRKLLSVLAVLLSVASLTLSIASLVWTHVKETDLPRDANRSGNFAAATTEDFDDSTDNPEISVGQSSAPLPSLRADATLTRKLDAARDFLETESWEEVTQLLQSLVDGSDDFLVAVKRDKGGREAASWTGLRTEAARLLGSLPAHGREFYEAMYGPRARRLLAEARSKGDIPLVADVARRYPHTIAGGEATELLGAHHLDRARYLLAAVCYERLLGRPEGAELPAATLFHAALAFRRGASGERAEQAWGLVAAKAPAGLRLGGAAVSLDDLKKELDRDDAAALGTTSRDALPAGGERGLRGPASLPRLEVKWSRPTAYETASRDSIRSAEMQHFNRGLPVVPASMAVAAGGRLVFRSTRGLHAVDLHTGREEWEAPSAWSIDRLLADSRYSTHVEPWIQSYLDVSPYVLYENAVLGTLSTDGGRVYAVDDLGVPPYRSNFGLRGRWQSGPPWPDFGPGLTDAAYYNRLLAVDAASGKSAWEIGGRGGDPDDDELSDTYFFGPPLPLDDRLYVLTEKNSLLSLACLRAADGAVVWRLPLAYAPSRLLLDPGRRIQAARPVWGNGFLVCPTNAGIVLGVDLLTPGLAWAYPYRTELLTRSETVPGGRRGRTSPARVVAEWKAPITVMAHGRVIFTAADEPSVHCLNARDGSLAWKAGRTADDVYLAGVFAGKVLIVGKQGCRALSLADGKQLWWLETGLPSGVGTAANHVYYLPLKEAGPKNEPAIYAIDVRQGSVLSRTTCPANNAPGNLVFVQGEVLSQSAAAVTAYRGARETNKED